MFKFLGKCFFYSISVQPRIAKLENLQSLELLDHANTEYEVPMSSEWKTRIQELYEAQV